MKTKSLISLVIILSIIACQKKNNGPVTTTSKTTIAEENFGPYGKVSKWKSIGGDTIFKEPLTLTYFHTEKSTPCNVHYYLQNISFWNCYDYTLDVSECITQNDTLICVDIDTHKKALFKREK